MNEFHVRIKLLSEILIKKKEALDRILNICENEETVIESGESGEALLREMAAEKQGNINLVLEADEIFQSTYAHIRDDFELRAKEYKDDVLTLKNLIGEVCDLDLKIRLAEDKNKANLSKKKRRPESRLPKAQVAKLYKE